MPAYKYQTKHGLKWLAKINYTDPETKLPVQIVKRGFATQKDAKTYEATFICTKKSPKNELTAESLFMDVCDAYWHHIDNRKDKIAKDTISTKKNIINNHILPFFSKYKIGKIDERAMTKWQEEIRAKTSKNGKTFSENQMIFLQNTLDKMHLPLYNMGVILKFNLRAALIFDERKRDSVCIRPHKKTDCLHFWSSTAGNSFPPPNCRLLWAGRWAKALSTAWWTRSRGKGC